MNSLDFAPSNNRPYAKVRAHWAHFVEEPHRAWTWRILEALYTEPHRAYHNLSHVAACLDLLTEVQDECMTRLEPVELALLWHDAVYVPGDKRNEELSANLLRSLEPVLTTHGGAMGVACAAILATRDHESVTDEMHAILTVDIDLSILGSSPVAYHDYVWAIRREYENVSDEAWRFGRGAFLEKMLARKQIFRNTWARDRFEEKARRNMQHELVSLKDTT